MKYIQGYLYGTNNEPMAIIDNVLPYSKLFRNFLLFNLCVSKNSCYIWNIATQRQCLSESVSGTTGIVMWQNVDSFKTFFKNNTKINPRVVEDVTIIAERISCNAVVSKCLAWMVNFIFIFFKINLSLIQKLTQQNDFRWIICVNLLKLMSLNRTFAR